MGTSSSYGGKAPTVKDVSKASNDGFAKKSTTHIHAGSTVVNTSGNSFRGDVRKGGKGK